MEKGLSKLQRVVVFPLLAFLAAVGCGGGGAGVSGSGWPGTGSRVLRGDTLRALTFLFEGMVPVVRSVLELSQSQLIGGRRSCLVWVLRCRSYLARQWSSCVPRSAGVSQVWVVSPLCWANAWSEIRRGRLDEKEGKTRSKGSVAGKAVEMVVPPRIEVRTLL